MKTKVVDYEDYTEYEGYTMGVCPICGCDNIEYGENEIEWAEVHYYFTCPKCGAEGCEVHKMEFKCMSATKDKE